MNANFNGIRFEPISVFHSEEEHCLYANQQKMFSRLSLHEYICSNQRIEIKIAHFHNNGETFNKQLTW